MPIKGKQLVFEVFASLCLNEHFLDVTLRNLMKRRVLISKTRLSVRLKGTL